MALEVRMPKLSDNMEQGMILRWMKSPGDQVVKGEPLAEVETDKADVEIEAADSGVLSEISVPAGQSAPVGAVIAVLTVSDEAPAREQPAPAAVAEPAVEPAKPPVAARVVAVPRAKAPPPPAAGPAQPRGAEAAAVGGARRASPLARRLAGQAGVDLGAVQGSGPGGRILARDVEASARVPDAADTPASAAASQPGTVEPGAVTRIEATRMRLAIAKRMTEAKRDVPHFYIAADIDMSEAMRLRESITRREAVPGLTVTHLLMRALAIALVRHPRVNASWRGDGIEIFGDVNIGVAVAVEDGLVVPVLRCAQALTLGEIAIRTRALTEKARTGKFSGEELTGGTFTLSNVGMLDVEELVAVINPPQAAVLAVAAVKDRPIVRNGQLAVAKTMRATLSCDHRVLNGVEGGRFLEELKRILEDPMALLLE